jgi:hypothetical protein
MKSPSSDRNARYHAFLRRLRAGGRSNMYGAIPYLMRTFTLDRENAFRIVCEWIDLQEAAQRESAGAPAPAPTPDRAGRRRAHRSRAA